LVDYVHELWLKGELEAHSCLLLNNNKKPCKRNSFSILWSGIWNLASTFELWHIYTKHAECSISINQPSNQIIKLQQELSYRKQIARYLRTQYAEGICRPKCYTVTLKSRLWVTRGHWKRNHRTDHTRLTISRVI